MITDTILENEKTGKSPEEITTPKSIKLTLPTKPLPSIIAM